MASKSIKKIHKINTQAVIGTFYTSQLLFKLDATDILEVANDKYYIHNEEIGLSFNPNYSQFYLRGRCAYGNISFGKNATPKHKHLFNVDLTYKWDGNPYVTPIYYYYTDDYEKGVEKYKLWLNTVYKKHTHYLHPTKEQIEMVFNWLQEINTDNPYPTLYKKASIYMIDQCIHTLTQSNRIPPISTYTNN